MTGLRLLLLTCLPFIGGAQPARRSVEAVDTAFARAVERLSEPGGFFDSDNLISNETSYLHVIAKLQAAGVRGGAYVGVGPDQNFSYIAHIRPAVAFLIDIRRDNLLQHLLLKALFAASTNRMEYLCRWLGRPVPDDLRSWTRREVGEMVTYLDSVRTDTAAQRRVARATLAAVGAMGVSLDARDREVLTRFHAVFMREGLDLRFSSFGRGNASTYPTLRRLLLERDVDGAQRSYLAREDAWRFVRDLQGAGQVIPVVGDLAGTRAFPAVADEVRRRRLTLSALYTSNAELYIWRDGRFGGFAETVARFPVDARSVIIRSFFDRGGSGHPLRVPGHTSVQLLQSVRDFTRHARAGDFHSYFDVVSLDAR